MWDMFKAETQRFRPWAIAYAMLQLVILGFMTRVVDLAQQPRLVYEVLVGVYGVISYGVTQRTREIGVRIALGARSSDVSGMFLRHAALLTGIGIAVGLGVAFGLTRLMSSLLFDVSPVDPMTYGLVSVALVATAHRG